MASLSPFWWLGATTAPWGPTHFGSGDGDVASRFGIKRKCRPFRSHAQSFSWFLCFSLKKHCETPFVKEM